jgi:hypothetical protein
MRRGACHSCRSCASCNAFGVFGATLPEQTDEFPSASYAGQCAAGAVHVGDAAEPNTLRAAERGPAGGPSRSCSQCRSSVSTSLRPSARPDEGAVAATPPRPALIRTGNAYALAQACKHHGCAVAASLPIQCMPWQNLGDRGVTAPPWPRHGRHRGHGRRDVPTPRRALHQLPRVHGLQHGAPPPPCSDHVQRRPALTCAAAHTNLSTSEAYQSWAAKSSFCRPLYFTSVTLTVIGQP